MSVASKYSHMFRGTALGVEHVFTGPGISCYACSIHFLQHLSPRAKELLGDEDDAKRKKSHGDFDADVVVNLLNDAYEAGHESMRSDLRELLEIPKLHTLRCR